MKVIIAGGGIAGLTMANALEKAGIDFVLLEARSLLDPQVGASIAIAPSAMRIFDQFGAAQEIIDQTTPVRYNKHHRKDGSLIMPPSTSMQVVKARFGYGFSFLDRQLVLRAMANTIKNEDKIQLNKRVKGVVHGAKSVIVECEDGSSYEGDIVVGCDGVHSKIRQEMWRLAAQDSPECFSEKERTKMTSEYICLFGISNPIPGIDEGDVSNVYDKGHSFLVISGKDGRIYWFYFEKLDKVYHYGEKDFPKYTKEDAEKLAEKHFWRPINEKFTLKDVWKQRVSYTLVPMEEALFDKWSWGRIATIGDSTHKMTANHGQAGNNAIESVAALANQLKRIHDANDTSLDAISGAFRKWQDHRRRRIEATCKEAADVCRDQCFNDFKGWFTLTIALPNLADYVADLFTDAFLGAEVLEYLPLPDRAFDGSCPFNPQQGTGHKESKITRVLKATALLQISYWAATSGAQSSGVLATSSTTANEGHWHHGLPSLNILFTLCSIYFIWLIESTRRANFMTLAQMPAVFAALGLYFGVGTVAPWYYFFHYISASLGNFAPADNRLTNVAYTRTALAGIILAFIGSAYLGSSMDMDWKVCFAPFLVSLGQELLVRTGLSTTNITEDAMKNPKKDVPYIRYSVMVLSGIATLLWWTSLLELAGNGLPLNLGTVQVGAATTVWLALLVHDLQKSGMIGAETPWWLLATKFVAGVLLLGPATAFVQAWWWREQTLATKHDKHAMTRERYAGKTFWEVQDELKASNGHVKANGSVPNGHAAQNGHVKTS